MFRKMNLNEIVEMIRSAPYETGIYVGCDSTQRKDYCVFATVVVIHHLRSRGANVFVKIDKTERIKSMKQRIMMEVSKAIETAISISNLVPTRPIEVHLDINTSSKFISNSIIKEAFGYVTAQGFKPVFKPESFAAYCVADYACKKYY
ncbi:MAG: ribonuclease H-like YkuK family protein [Brevinematia bacterium]|jgi:predicted RNase H-related nuclease YkuK (DUF458 family)